MLGWEVTVLSAVEKALEVQLCRGLMPNPEPQSLSPRDDDGIGVRLVTNLQYSRARILMFKSPGTTLSFYVF